MVKVKNKLLVALSLMLCAVLLSAVMVFVNDNKNSSKISADSTIENPTAPGYYELNADGTAWELNMEWAQFKANHVTTTDGHLQVRNTSSKIITGFLVWGDMDASDPAITDLSTAFASSDCSLEWVDKTSVQSLSGIDLKKLDVSKVTTMQRMFASYDGTTNLSYLDVSNFETGLVTDMSGLFYGCSKLLNIDVSNFDTKSVKNMKSMFMSCSSLTELNLSNFSTESIEVTESYRSEDGSIVEYTGLADMFAMCSNLKTLDISGFDTSNVNETGAMSRSLYNCYKLTQIKTPKVMGDTTIPLYLEENSENHYALYSATETAITEINKGMANSVVELFDSSNNSLADTPYTGNEPDENPDQGEDKDPLSKPGYYEQVNGEWKMIKTWDEVKSSSLFFDSMWIAQGQLKFVTSSYTGYLVLGDFDTTITNISYQSMSAVGDTVGLSAIDFRNFDSSCLTSMSFSRMPVSQIIFGNNFDSSKITDVYGMFQNCTNLTSIDISMLDFTNAYSYILASGSNLFYNCTSLKEIKFPKNFVTTSNTTNLLSGMFYGCTSLEVLDMRDWDLSSFSITPTTVFIETCTGLKRILLPDTLGGSFQLPTTSNGNYYALRSDKITAITSVTTGHAGEIVELYDSNGNSLAPTDSELDNMKIPGLYASKDSDTLILSWNKFKQYMSVTDGKLQISTYISPTNQLTLTGTEHLVLGKWTGDTITSLGGGMNSAGIYTSGTFQDLAIGSIDFNTFDVSNVTNMAMMLSSCTNLKSVDFGDNFDTSNVTDMSSMFGDCTNLTNVSFGEKFNTSNVTSMKSMFGNCANLTGIEFPSSFNTASVTNMNNMFNGCKSLTSLDLSMFDTSKVIDFIFMFSNCKALKVLNISSFEIDTSLTLSDVANIFGNKNGWDSTTMTSVDTSCSSLQIVYGPKKVAAELLSLPTDSLWKDLNTSVILGGTPDTECFPETNGESHTLVLQDGTAVIINLNANGGVVTDVNGNTIVRLAEMEYGKLPIPTCAGKKFLGWYTALEGGDLITETTLVPTVSSEQTIRLYAHWSNGDAQKTYTITYKANFDGVEDVVANTAEDGTFVTKEDTLFTRDGYTFIGWSTSADSLVGNYQNASTSFTTTENLVLYAIWEKEATIDLPNTWKEDYKEQTGKEAYTITSIIFTRTLPEGYGSEAVVTLSTGLKIFANLTDSTKIAFVYDGIIYAPEDSTGLFYTTVRNSQTFAIEHDSETESIIFENFDTSNVVTMVAMFCGTKLTNLDISMFNTSKVTNMDEMFAGVSTLTELDVSNFDTSKVENFSGMFMEIGVEFLDLSNFSMESISNNEFMGGMFMNCANLTQVRTPKIVPQYTIETNKYGYPTFSDQFKMPYEMIVNGSCLNYSWFIQGTNTLSNYLPITNGQSYVLERRDPIEYTITYVLNGGTNNTNPTKFSGATTTLTAPTKIGYTFDGWYNNSSFTGSAITALNSNTITQDTTLYAKWIAKTYNVKKGCNYGSISVNSSGTYGSSLRISVNEPSQTGYNFTFVSVMIYSGSNTNGKLIDGRTSQSFDYTMDSTYYSSIYVYAAWTRTAINYTITYNTNGGDSLANKTYTIETASFKLPTPTKAGYNFLGWTGTGISTPTKDVTITKGTTGNKTFTANWELARTEIADITVTNGKAYEYTEGATTYENAISSLTGTIGKVNNNIGVFDLVAENNASVTLSIANAEVSNKENVHIMHFNGTSWEDVTAKATSLEYDNENKTLTIQMQLDSYSPVVVVEATPDIPETPETGVVANSLVVLIALLSTIAMGYAVSKKKMLNK